MRTRHLVTILFLFAILGCSKGNQGAPTLSSSGKHPAGWVVAASGGNHPVSYLASPGQCFECHGKDLTGGISKVSCFSSNRSGISCHAIGPQGHPADFRMPENHGARAKAALGGVSGLAFCKNCHGSDYRGAGSSRKDCIGCHQLAAPATLAPHSPQPWRDGTTTHTNTDQSNAAACAQCHTAGANLRVQYKLPGYAGGTPGCFNSTLCHGMVGHTNEARQPWSAPDNHGAAAKGDPAMGDGLAICKTCHGQALTGSGAAVSCFSCHATAPHSPRPWRRSISATTGRVHTDTNTLNATVCAGCHINNQRLTTPVTVNGTPTCFDNSMCHGPTGHNDTTLFPVPSQAWKTPVNHGAKAKGSTAVGASGFSYCRNCHGDGGTLYPLFKGGTALTSCMNALGCHGLLNDAPHPSRPWRGITASGSTGHSTADTTNANICAICHTGGANSTRVPQAGVDLVGSTGCFNATMCHGVTGHTDTAVYPSPWGAAANHGKFARSEPGLGGINGLAYCQHCHGANFSGGSTNQSCYACHTVSAPHPKRADWTLKAGALSHVNAGEGNAAICATCHSAAAKNLSEPYLTRFASSPAGSFSPATAGCYNASMCHGDVRKTSNCDACHSIATSIPFKSLAGAAGTNDPTVGAHVKHLNASIQAPAFSANIACSECHAVPTSPAVSGSHRNGANDITFGPLAKTGALTPAYAAATGACANTYCHGTTLTGGGSNKAPVWNQSDYLTAAGCGTCHGFPPTTVRNGAAAHSASGACSGCHSHVNAAATGFTDPAKHINGVVDVSGSAHAFPYGGSVHMPGGTGALLANTKAPYTNCSGCHDTTSTGGTYPVAAGTKPLCSACHINMTNFTGASPGCWDCHGSSATNGRPNGSTFPNIASRHSSPGVHAVTCAVCHAGGGTGVASHGDSNRIKKSSASVTLQFSITGTVANDSNLVISGSGSSVRCSGVCHISGGSSRNHQSDSW